MISEINKITLSWLLSILMPGAVIVFMLIWDLTLYLDLELNIFTSYEGVTVFFIVVFAFVIGILNDTISQIIEMAAFSRKEKNPRTIVAKKNPHWVEELDAFYFKYTGIHLYDWDKKNNLPKEGDINGKKLNLYNLSQFEHFANFILAKEKVSGILETEKSKYLLLRNLCYAFIITSLFGLVNTFITEMEFFENFIQPTGLVRNGKLIRMISFIQFAMAVFLFFAYRKTRISYLTQLYRYIRYYYLTTLKA